MINLYVNYYKDKVPARQKEIDTCIQKNITNSLVNVLVLESQSKVKYNDFFKVINSYTGDNDINIICNSDIYLDSTISIVSSMSGEEALALGRWELGVNGVPNFCNRPDSQDTWVFKGKVRNVFGDFCLGLPGCDNRIAHEMRHAGYKVSNPAKSIKTIHIHRSGVRNYPAHGAQRKSMTVPGPYVTINPTEWERR